MSLATPWQVRWARYFWLREARAVSLVTPMDGDRYADARLYARNVRLRWRRFGDIPLVSVTEQEALSMMSTPSAPRKDTP